MEDFIAWKKSGRNLNYKIIVFRVVYTREASRDLERISQEWQGRIHRAVESLSLQPFRGKKLKGKLSGKYSLRVWPYRIIYLVSKKEITVFIINIGHRQGIYG